MELPEVLKSIDNAFVGTVRDEECTLHQAQFADHFGDQELTEAEWNAKWEAEKLRDPETDWRDIPPGALDECDAAQSHASPESWHFYLPAYMRRALDLLDADLWSEDLPGSVIFHLTYRDGSRGYLLERFTKLNEAQQGTVVAFLEYVRDYPSKERWNSRSAAEALASYWALPAAKRPTGQIIIAD